MDNNGQKYTFKIPNSYYVPHTSVNTWHGPRIRYIQIILPISKHWIQFWPEKSYDLSTSGIRKKMRNTALRRIQHQSWTGPRWQSWYEKKKDHVDLQGPRKPKLIASPNKNVIKEIGAEHDTAELWRIHQKYRHISFHRLVEMHSYHELYYSA